MGPAVHETQASEWEAMFAMNVVTARNMGAYCVAKSAVMRLTESLSKELRQRGINVNAVLPSIIDTPTNRRDMPDADFAKWVALDELAEVICFLGSDAARAIHGALVPVVGLS